jgi:hypothetical protein
LSHVMYIFTDIIHLTTMDFKMNLIRHSCISMMVHDSEVRNIMLVTVLRELTRRVPTGG